MNPFFAALDDLVRTSSITIDRPAGSSHPRYAEIVYPIDYGFLDATTAADGGGIDVFVGSARDAGVVAAAITIDRNKRDAEIKVMIDCTEDEIEAVHSLLGERLNLGVEILRRLTSDD